VCRSLGEDASGATGRRHPGRAIAVRRAADCEMPRASASSSARRNATTKSAANRLALPSCRVESCDVARNDLSAPAGITVRIGTQLKLGESKGKQGYRERV
jgi:hypothetical protein